jgi:hypothetical protein
MGAVWRSKPESQNEKPTGGRHRCCNTAKSFLGARLFLLINSLTRRCAPSSPPRPKGATAQHLSTWVVEKVRVEIGRKGRPKMSKLYGRAACRPALRCSRGRAREGPPLRLRYQKNFKANWMIRAD